MSLTSRANHIVIVEDDSELARLTQVLLEEEGYIISQVNRGDLAVEHIRIKKPDLVILDIMLPGKNGIEVCTEIRKFFDGPVLMLTGRDDDITEVSSFNQGADDYVLKPVKPHILIARISALLRRTNREGRKSLDLIVLGTLEVSLQRREVKLEGAILELTSSEFELLFFMAENSGIILSREACCQQLRGFEYDGSDRSIDMRISSLRKKLNDDSPPHFWIKTIRGKGYMLAVAESMTE